MRANPGFGLFWKVQFSRKEVESLGDMANVKIRKG